MKPPILSETDIEQRALDILAAYEQRTGKTIVLPVPIEKVSLQVLDLPVEYDVLPALPGDRAIVSKLRQPRFGLPATIVLNSDLTETLFSESPGLENTAIAHEAGHGLFHLDRGRVQQLDLGFGTGDDFVSDAVNLDDPFTEVLGRRGPVGDDWWREWQAHTFMRYVLMPRRLLLPLIAEGGYRSWRGRNGLYELRDRCGVTISALIVHLHKLGIARVDQDRRIHDLASLAQGQYAFRA